jgi:hypothetical protein
MEKMLTISNLWAKVVALLQATSVLPLQVKIGLSLGTRQVALLIKLVEEKPEEVAVKPAVPPVA